MATFNFPSLAEPDKIGFSFDSQACSQYPKVDECCLSFDTYGDGMCQHSVAWPISADRAADYFASMATFLLDNPVYVDTVGWKMKRDVNVKNIEFAATVVYKEPKPEKRYTSRRYYSKEERKVTAADKRNDRRYEEIEPWMDGKPEAIVRILYQSYYSPLQAYALNNAVRDWCQDGEDRGWLDMPGIGERDMKHDAKYEQHTAWEMLQSVIRHIEGMACARRQVESWKGNLERAQQRKVEAVSDAA